MKQPKPNDRSGEVLVDVRVKIPKTLHDELVNNVSRPEINALLVESLHEGLRKLRFRHALGRTQPRRK